MATVVFPIPAAPTMLTNRHIINCADKARMVSPRPIMRVSLGGSLCIRSETAASLDDEDCGVENVTAATKQYPRPGTVTM
jgi:hypothetical protein